MPNLGIKKMKLKIGEISKRLITSSYFARSPRAGQNEVASQGGVFSCSHLVFVAVVGFQNIFCGCVLALTRFSVWLNYPPTARILSNTTGSGIKVWHTTIGSGVYKCEKKREPQRGVALSFYFVFVYKLWIKWISG